jgi:uncharacterized membrane protein
MATTTPVQEQAGLGRLVPVAAEDGPLEEAGVEDLADSVAVAEVSVAAAPARAGNSMRTKEFLSKLEHDQIVHAIRDAESNTSGQIRVYIQRGKADVDPLVAAQTKFHRLGMHKTPKRNAVLIFVAPRAHKFAVVGDKAIHEKCGEQFWQQLVHGIREHFRNEKFTDALVEAIREAGNALATHFPRGSTSSGQLPDNVIET